MKKTYINEHGAKEYTEEELKGLIKEAKSCGFGLKINDWDDHMADDDENYLREVKKKMGVLFHLSGRFLGNSRSSYTVFRKYYDLDGDYLGEVVVKSF